MTQTNNISISKKAADKINNIIISEKKDLMLKISVLGGGCSGFKYNFTFDDKIEKDDLLFNKTLIDKESLNVINGSIVDYKKEMIGDSFTIKNPKASSSCGCGLSFSV